MGDNAFFDGHIENTNTYAIVFLNNHRIWDPKVK
jgi:hypothetical protein